MPALNFQKQFVSAVEDGTKRQTIRALRKRPFKVGDVLYLYAGMRTKQCKKLATVACVSAEHIWINSYRRIVEVRNRQLDKGEVEMLAKSDGFMDAKAMYAWFCKTHSNDFYGDLIKW